MSGTPVVAILRPARTPKGTEVRTVIKHVTKRLRTHWPNTRIVWRGDSHYGRVEAMEWAEDNGVDYIFGLAGNTPLDALVAETADNLRFHHAKSSHPKLRTYASFTYQAGVGASLYTILQILSLTLFEKIPLVQLLNDTALENFDDENPTQLNLFS
jgi:Transposase DDE domain group 1